MNQKLELNIAEVSLDGFPKIDVGTLGAALETELARILKERGLPPRFSAESNERQMDFGKINLSQNSGSRALGRKIAHNLYSGFHQVQKKQTRSPETAMSKEAGLSQNRS